MTFFVRGKQKIICLLIFFTYRRLLCWLKNGPAKPLIICCSQLKNHTLSSFIGREKLGEGTFWRRQNFPMSWVYCGRMQDRISILYNVRVSLPERYFSPFFFSLRFSFFPVFLLMIYLFWLLRVVITGSTFSLCFAHACLTTWFLALHQLSDLQKQKSSILPSTQKSITYIFLPGFKNSNCVSH